MLQLFWKVTVKLVKISYLAQQTPLYCLIPACGNNCVIFHLYSIYEASFQIKSNECDVGGGSDCGFGASFT